MLRFSSGLCSATAQCCEAGINTNSIHLAGPGSRTDRCNMDIGCSASFTTWRDMGPWDVTGSKAIGRSRISEGSIPGGGSISAAGIASGTGSDRGYEFLKKKFERNPTRRTGAAVAVLAGLASVLAVSLFGMVVRDVGLFPRSAAGQIGVAAPAFHFLTGASLDRLH